MDTDLRATTRARRVPRVVCTRERPGRLEALISARGFEPVHIGLIEVVDIEDSAPVHNALAALAGYDWLVVTSRHGAARVGAAAKLHPGLGLAAVGTTTAATLAALAGRAVDVVPTRQNAAGLIDAFPIAGSNNRVLIMHADRATDELAVGLVGRGYTVEAVDAYSTRLRQPGPGDRSAAASADAVLFASGSAAEAWAATLRAETPPNVVAIGPTTAAMARQSGLEVTAVAADHSLEGLADMVARVLQPNGHSSS